MARRRRRRSAPRRSNGGGGSIVKGMGRFGKVVEAGLVGYVTGVITKQRFFAQLPAIAGSRLLTAAVIGGFASEQGGTLGKWAGKIGESAATIASFQFGRGDVVSGAPTTFARDGASVNARLNELEDRIRGDLDFDDEDIEGDDDAAEEELESSAAIIDG